MIATSRKSAFTPTVSRRFEFSRLHHHTLACAYEVLLPAASRHRERFQPRRGDDGLVGTRAASRRPSAVGA
jgi:hypothetical protein